MILSGLIVGFHQSFDGYLSVDVFSALANYNFMVFGFTIAAMAIVFAVPSSRFISFLVEAGRARPDTITKPWEKALFILAWSGVIHFFALLISMATLSVCFNYSEIIKPTYYDIDADGTKLTFWFVAGFQIYAMLQFLAALLTVFFFCALFIKTTRDAVEAGGTLSE